MTRLPTPTATCAQAKKRAPKDAEKFAKAVRPIRARARRRAARDLFLIVSTPHSSPSPPAWLARQYVMGSYNVEESMRDRYLADAKSDAKEAK